jgi:hypothetical protein
MSDDLKGRDASGSVDVNLNEVVTRPGHVVSVRVEPDEQEALKVAIPSVVVFLFGRERKKD